MPKEHRTNLAYNVSENAAVSRHLSFNLLPNLRAGTKSADGNMAADGEMSH